MKKRILVIVNSPLFVVQHIRPILDVLSRTREVFVVTNCKTSYRIKVSSVRYIHSPIARSPALLDFLCLLHVCFIRVLLRPEISLSFTPKGGLFNALTAWLPGKTIHYFTGQRWITFTGFKRRFYIFLDRIIVGLCRLVLCDSFSQSSYLSSVLSCAPPLVILNGSISGVDCRKFTPSSIASVSELMILLDKYTPLIKRISHDFEIGFRDVNDIGVIFAFIGRIHPDKGINELVEAFAVHSLRYSSSVLLVVGPWEFDCDIQAHPISSLPNCVVLPFVSDIVQVYRSIDCLLLPSYREGFGSVVIEAAACRKPSIVTRIPGLTDFVEHNVNGLFIEPRSSSAIVDSLDFFAHAPGLLVEFGRAARAKALSHYSSEIVCNEFSDLIEAV